MATATGPAVKCFVWEDSSRRLPACIKLSPTTDKLKILDGDGLAMPFEARAPGHVDALRAATARRLQARNAIHDTTNNDTDGRAAARDWQ